MTSSADELIAVGRIGPARGVRGETFVEPWTDSPAERFAPGAVLRTDRAYPATLTVQSASNASGKQVVHFADVADRPAAEGLRGIVLFVHPAEREPLEDPDEFYDTDLVGLTVRGVDGTEHGAVTGVTHAGAAAYLVVATADGERLVPFVSAIVPSVDVAGGQVLVDPPEGLFEL